MTINIDLADQLDVCELANHAEAQYAIMIDRDADGKDVEDACDTLEALKELLIDLGMGFVPFSAVADKLRDIARTTPNPIMYTKEAFVKSVREYVDDVRCLPLDLPSFVVIDWEETAKNVEREHYSKAFLGGKAYLIRR